MSQYTVAILGATGLVGSHLMKILEQRQFPVKRLVPLASENSAGKTVTFKGEEIPVVVVSAEAFEGVDIVLASAGAGISAKWVPEAVKRGAVVVDNTSHYRMMPDVPLVVAGVNDEDLEKHQGIIANPNCSTMQLMPVFKALEEAAGLERVIVSTYQSVSGAGKEAMAELEETCGQMLAETNGNLPENKIFKRPIAFNLIPHIDVFVEEGEGAGYTKEEYKVVQESRKILHLPDLRITATAVRVPVMIGHSESVTIDFKRPLTPQAAADILRKVPDVIVGEMPEDYHTPLEIAGSDPVDVSRIRRDTSNPERGLNMWIVADNLRIGAALNAVRLAEELVKRNLVTRQTVTA